MNMDESKMNVTIYFIEINALLEKKKKKRKCPSLTQSTCVYAINT